MKILFILLGVSLFIGLVWVLAALPIRKNDLPNPNEELIKLSSNLLYRIKMNEPTDSIQIALSGYSLAALQQGISNNKARKVFWINIYNAYYQIFATQGKNAEATIYTDKGIRFADITLSLDDIEHGILRKYRWKYSLGYLPQFFPAKTIKQLAVNDIDFRIHFALNCGAKSCPPIAFYSYENLDAQLEIAAKFFLESETDIDNQMKVVHVTKIMQWFKGDFGGDEGIRKILRKYFNKDFSSYKIVYKNYDWTTDLKNFSVE